MLKILHIAPQNYAGVPYDFYRMHLSVGDHSRIITLHKNIRDFPEDICLDLPLPNFSLAKKWRKNKVDVVESKTKKDIYFKPKNFAEKIYFKINDKFKENTINKTIEEYHLNDFDIIHFDAGLGFYRNAKQAKEWKKEGKKIVCCYYGSDLRIRGVIRELDEISDLNITSEYDHLAMKDDLQYLFYPFDISELPERQLNQDDIIRIIHSPTNRKYKGTNLIISVIEKIKKEKKIEFLLIEDMKRSELLKIKNTCDICIDQVGGTMGGTGYGKAGLETLGMGIPTITNMSKEYQSWLPENPFTVANNGDELYQKLNELIDNKDLRLGLGQKGKAWVEKYHGYKNVDKRLKELYRLKNII